MDNKINKFLTKVMGLCWHERKDFSEDGYGTYKCIHCGKVFGGHGGQLENKIDFSTWEGFGKLWEWAQKQDWWEDFSYYMENTYFKSDNPSIVLRIKPKEFTEVLYKFLKERADQR